MNRLQIWFSFHKPERQFHKLSHNLLRLPSKLKYLNEKRAAIQVKIIELGIDSNACHKCQGACCRSDYNHFTVADYLIRMFSMNRIEDYGDIWEPKSFFSILVDLVKEKKPPAQEATREKDTKCPNLTPTGCEFKPQDRPIRCVLWTCNSFRQSLPSQKLKEIGKLTRELNSISIAACKILRKDLNK